MIRFAPIIALGSIAVHDIAAQCRPVVPEAYETTSVGRVLLDHRAESSALPNGAPHTFVRTSITYADKPGTGPSASILGIWVRSDSVWTKLELQKSSDAPRAFPFVHAFGGPAWRPGTNLDVLTEWKLDAETVSHCSLLRSTVTAVLYTAPTVILKESTARDPAGVAKNTGRLVVALRDANNPLSPIREKSLIAVEPDGWPGRTGSGRPVFAEPETDIIPFDQIPAKPVLLTVAIFRFQTFRAIVDIAADCETVVEVFLGPRQGMHAPPVTATHATVTTCAPVRCFGTDAIVIPCAPIAAPKPGPLPAVKRDSTDSKP